MRGSRKKKDFPEIFLDSEVKFDIHDLKQFVRETEKFVLIVTPGIFESQYCCIELATAIESKRPIFVVRDAAYEIASLEIDMAHIQVQAPMTSEIKLHLLSNWNTYPAVLWTAEFNEPCIDLLYSRLEFRPKTAPMCRSL